MNNVTNDAPTFPESLATPALPLHDTGRSLSGFDRFCKEFPGEFSNASSGLAACQLWIGDECEAKADQIIEHVREWKRLRGRTPGAIAYLRRQLYKAHAPTA